jgi:predicted kinase
VQAIIFIGIQASGKSTFFKQRFFHSHVRINLDMLRTRYREKRLTEICIELTQPFVVDNTNPSIDERARYILPAKQAGFEVIGYYFQSRIADSIQRNKDRHTEQQIPERGILGAAARLKRPSLNEGFDRLYYVRIIPDLEFSVEDWMDEV